MGGHYVNLDFLSGWFYIDGLSFAPDGSKVALVTSTHEALYLAAGDFSNAIGPINIYEYPRRFTWSPDMNYVLIDYEAADTNFSVNDRVFNATVN
jgi:hypothetical protein